MTSPTHQIDSGRQFMRTSLIGAFHDGHRFIRTVTSLVLFFFLWTNIHPAVAAIKASVGGAPLAPFETIDQGLQDRLEKALQDEVAGIREQVKATHDLILKTAKRDARGNSYTDITIIGTPEENLIRQHQQRILEIGQEFREVEEKALDAFARSKEAMEVRQLPPIAFERHENALRDFAEKSKEFHNRLAKLATTTMAGSLHDQSQALIAELGSWQPRERSIDPKNLPFSTTSERVRAPLTAPSELNSVISGERLSVEAKPPAQRKLEVTSSEVALIEEDDHTYRLDRGQVEVAGPAAPVPAPGPEYLASTEDVQITPEIRELSVSLHGNPLEIYNWVYNNIEFLPTYGSIQGSQMTLDKRAGNAFDTSSLLIALLRAADVPARYVYGTIDVPIGPAMNWAGGLTRAEAAQQLLGQGGIPNVGLTKGGQIFALRMEHVWVEAWIDYYPSRGARNVQGDTWIPLDASYKAHEFRDGLPLESVTFDVDAFLAAAGQGAQVDPIHGVTQNINHVAVRSFLADYEDQLSDYVADHAEDTSSNGVLGSSRIREVVIATFPSALPYRVVMRANPVIALPDSLQSRFTYAIYASDRDIVLEAPLLEYTTETVKIAQKPLALVFVPEGDADREIMAKYVPKQRPDGTMPSLEEFPRSIPAYSVHMVPELRVDGLTVVRSGAAFSLGTRLLGRGGFTNMSLGGYDITPDDLVVGQVSALGISLGGITNKQVATLKERIAAVKAQVESSVDPSRSLEQIVADLQTATVWSYFQATEIYGGFLQRVAQVVDVPGLSYGFFHAMVAPIGTYGITTAVQFPGALLDIGHVRRVAYSKDNDGVRWAAYNRARGRNLSEMEHFVPEGLFADPSDGAAVRGFSAVRGLQVASVSGQKIYLITPATSDQIEQLHQSSSVMENVRNAVAAGLEATVSESPVSYGGFHGAGYFLEDTETGGGAYLIEGGANGSYLDTYAETTGDRVFAGLFAISVLAIFATSAATTLPFLLLLTFFIGAFNVFMNTMIADLELRANACPPGASALLWAVGIAFLMFGRAPAKPETARALAIYGFITSHAVTGAAPACAALANAVGREL